MDTKNRKYIMASSTTERLDPFSEDKVGFVIARLIYRFMLLLKAELQILTRKPVCFVIFGKPVRNGGPHAWTC